METKIELFDSNTIEQLIWPNSEEGLFAKKLLIPLVKDGAAAYFHNIKTEMMVLKVDDLVLPITINDFESDNSYVCSFYNYYIGLGSINASTIKNKLLRYLTTKFLMSLGIILKLGNIDKIVSVNNWLFSTNLYPKLNDSQILSIREFIQQKFPKHAIVFRSINKVDKNSPLNTLRNSKFHLIASRQIFLNDTKETTFFESRLFKGDLKLLKKTDYILDDLKNDFESTKILSLYNEIYLDKYSKLNPQLNEKFVKLLIQHQIFNFKTLQKNDRIDGVIGYYSAHGVMSSPFFGYNTKVPQQANLYRLLSTVLTLEAKNKKQLYNQSSGASFYKSIRKANPTIEYSAVYIKHLSLSSRFMWKTLKVVINTFGIHWMKKY